jgi:type IV pilus assembly protein PilV
MRARGVTMIEVLVTIVILTFGLLGVVGLQARMQLAQAESYHRSQAILLMQDMVDRVAANRANALNYVTATPLGTGNVVQDCSGLTGAALDLCEWNNALLGATESTAGGQNVAVTWQGLVPTVAPAATPCGQGQYGNDQMRRALVARVMIGCLQNDPTTGLCVTP